MHPKVTKKAVTKAISLRTKKVFLVKCSVSSCQEKKKLYDIYLHLCQDRRKV